MDWPVPQNPTEVQQFLGFTGYYWYFVPNYSKITQPLLDLTKKNLVWQWEEPQHRAFEEHKTRMCCSPVLTQLNFKEKFYLQTNASAYGMGTILSQRGKTSQTLRKWSKLTTHPITYYSTMFTLTKRNYNIYITRATSNNEIIGTLAIIFRMDKRIIHYPNQPH
jgi:hypothetical protein